mmetsp:Transcript_29758/g.45541  ORF Transcript_29758/g.45541 Transcript_29758/m.45541 type:complete len:312 (-) Transcript_29758:390-1325(-)|eukprot:CAMPEP_0194102116 /NCGR_PEP_ID=MMETSP0150-20130528/2773_1 /TAXON_ID=122233 /ORGANISM="Chaetoceros debilis, Strain MM31A-1" /LENGTH=311 /DNA_ID=CAMNT_0038788977 /DNA_START=67 /DNA_END=1002 /DNA_ORIENTATION=-
MKLISLCSLIVGTSAFAPARTLPSTNSAININQNLKYFSANAKFLNAAASPPPVSKPPVPSPDKQKVPELMGQDIYNFNKFLIDTVYDIICFFYPVSGTKRDFARFYVLETVARVPYFAYLSVMHLRETFGERELGDKMRTHYAEADNELHHLLIMESLGGNENVVDRILAQSMAFGYYWYVTIVYFFNPAVAYHLSELIEDHAYDTYSGYLRDHGELLKTQEVPAVANKYYVEDNPFLFDLFCTVKDKDEQGDFSTRRPKLDNLYDVFVNIRDDEKEHWKTLCNLVQYGDMQGVENSLVQPTKAMPKELK